MFDQQEYINRYIKDKYKTIKLRIKNSDRVIINKIESIDNINQYLISLIKKDIYDTRTYNFINNDIDIDFELSSTMDDLIKKADEADILKDYGLYMNLSDAIYSQGKKEVTHHQLSEGQWNKLTRRFCL